MKRRLAILITTTLLMPFSMMGQSYQSMWKQVEDAQEKDLPKTALSHLQKIEKKAAKERAYGQLLKSTLLHAKLQAEVAPDSLQPAVKRLEKEEKAAKDIALKAVYDVALSKIYADNHELADNWDALRADYQKKAKAHPEVLAQTKAGNFEPFVVKEKDSDYFGHDLLSIVGMELNEWQWLAEYYQQTGQRHAACLAASYTANDIQRTDSLIQVYGDLQEAGELAIRRYELMGSQYSAAEINSWLEQSLQRWGQWRRANILRNALTALNNPSYQVRVMQKVNEVNKPLALQLTQLRNLQQMTIRVWRTQLKGDTSLNPEVKEDYQKMKGGLTEVKELTRTLTFSGHASYDFFEDSLQLAGLPAGVYLLEFSSNPETHVSRALYFVSGIRLMSQAQPDNKMRYVVVDATTGQPVSGATLQLSFNKSYQQEASSLTLTSDKKGEAYYDYSDKRPSSVFVYTATDNSLPTLSSYGSYTYYDAKYNDTHTQLFTDRSIYRPGQRVQVTAIVWKEVSATDNEAVANKQITLTLRDANYKEVSQQEATTDRFGKCHATFTLPTGKLNGVFTIQTSGNTASFRVEEYKRPTFEVKFDDYKESYQAGDTVKVQGKATTYAGVPVMSGKVKYTVKRRVAFWWMNYSRYWQQGYIGKRLQDEVVGEGECQTADDGTFTVAMPMTLPDDLGKHTMFYHFVAEADVTDQAGETHQGSLSLPLGNKPTVLTCDIPQQVRSDQMPPVVIYRRNAAGKEIAGTVKYCLDGKKWQSCTANSPFSIQNSQLKSGEHRLEAICEQDTIKTTFVVFGINDKVPATPTHDWFYVSDKQFPNNGQPVTVQVGSSDPDLHIVYSIYAGKQEIERGSLKKNAALENRKFTYKEEYGNGLLVTYAWVKNGECHHHQQFIRRPMPDKVLKMSWETFRDRLTPGQQEEWRLKINKPDGTPAEASLMAVLYDKSLDAIKKHQWTFTPSNHLSQPSTSWQWRQWHSLYLSGSKSYKTLDVDALAFSSFDYSVFPVYRHALMHKRFFIRGSKGRVQNDNKVFATMIAPATEGVMMAKNMAVAVADEENITVGYAAKGQEEQATEEVQVRENLQETAFCYPTLTTDKEGIVSLKFTLPESLTTWRFMGIANTTDMLFGNMDAEVIAQKEVMIQPNIPRFVRMGDAAQIAARIFNTSDKEYAGTARIQLIDPATDKVVAESSQPVTIAGNKTTSVTFPCSPKQEWPALLICKVTAAGEGFSDGEQHYLPVLPDDEMVTKTVPYTQHEPGTKSIDLTKLFPQGTQQQKLTIEYTNNPAWLMVQSLPIVGQPHEQSAIDQAASYYSNQLAKVLLAQSPQVKSVFAQWKQEELTADRSALTSQLQNNEELKDLLLTETPWVYAAEKENEQRQLLAEFFDENAISDRLSTAIEKLQQLQNPDGSFSWFPRMEGNTSITAAVVEMLARLNVLTGTAPTTTAGTTVTNGSPIDVTPLYDKAFNYMGQQMVELVAKLKKEEKKGVKPVFPSFTALRWLYICAIDGRQLPADVKAANSYLIPLLKKDIKRQTIYEKALTAVVLAQRGEKTTAAEYVKSLKEYTVYTEEMGRYYDTRRASYSWYDYKIPTEVAAIEAIQRITPDDRQTVDEMRRWLLQEKRTQVWNTPINSVNAIYAFLSGHSQSLTSSQPAAVLAIDGTPIDTSKATAGIGYVKTALDGSAVSTARTFTATKTSKGTSWGAVYAQFQQKTTDIEASQSGITVKREVIAERQLSALQVGDRVKVRITIESSRDLDFVQVVDRRAACMEPVSQLTGYQNGAFRSPKDYATCYFLGQLPKGRTTIETEYYLDRAGQYETGTCTVGCAYAPEYRATAPSITLNIE